LRAVLDALDQGSQKAPLSHESEPMSSFIQAMEHFFPDLTTPFEQDAADFFLPILRAILPPDHREGKDFFLRKIRQGGEESNCLRMGLLAGQVEPTVENLLAACSIRSVEDTDAEFTPILLLHPRDKGEPQSVSDVFSDIKDSEVYLENFATEKYNPWLTNEHLAILRKAADPKGKIPLIKYSETQLLKGKAPTFLPINIARFANKGPDTRKNSCPVKPLFHLQVPVQYRIKPVQYKMTGVTVHLGETRKCGHYITYVPDLSSPEINGFPSAWIELNDSRTIPVSWESIEKIVEENATLYMYDIDQ
jgi:hypothetical protein